VKCLFHVKHISNAPISFQDKSFEMTLFTVMRLYDKPDAEEAKHSILYCY